MILGIGDDNDRQRYPRFLRSGFDNVIRQINRGKSIIWKTYLSQFLQNFRTNYSFVYNSYFSKVFEDYKKKKST